MILEVNKLRKEVSSGESKLVILDDVSFDLLEGQSLAITGPSGSGKSTLLGLLAGLDTATSGEIYLNKEALHELDEEQRALLRKEKVGFVFQSFELLPSLTALENVMLPSELKDEDEPEERAKYFLDRVGLKEREHHYPNQLSGGEQQRVAIARAFACSAKILFADEPTGNLDPKNGEMISDLLFEVNSETDNALVVVTHDHDLADRCDKKINLKSVSYTHLTLPTNRCV